MTTITIDIPDQLRSELLLLGDRIPEVLALGLNELRSSQNPTADEASIIAVLASQPSPAQILELHPSLEMQKRASELLTRSKENHLTTQEAAELERYLTLEHLVRMAKAHALQRLSSAI